jgi:ubiquinone/menaquinone biosynthesis C-methylase UbiE
MTVMQSNRVLAPVKAQYHDYPYPPRNPDDEKSRLIHTVGGGLFILNHHCFNGRLDVSSGFRCLIAGGGTGDCAIYLAEQLRKFDAEIVYLDFSDAARAIAEERAKVRGLKNITWITSPIQKIPELKLGNFDFINCSGVLHHLESTEAGLDILANTLKSDGAMYLMLYAKYGRNAVYDMQQLLRDYLPADAKNAEKVELARQLIDALPETNSFRRDIKRWASELSKTGLGDSGLFDLLLHSQDRCFTVPQIYDLTKNSGLNFLGFTGTTPMPMTR